MLLQSDGSDGMDALDVQEGSDWWNVPVPKQVEGFRLLLQVKTAKCQQ
jgi:hypothetical protein